VGEAGGAELFLNQGAGVLGTPLMLPGESYNWGGLAVADFDHDGVADICLLAIGHDGIVVLLNQVDAGFSETDYPVSVNGEVMAFPTDAALPNLALARSNGVQLLVNSGAGAFGVGDLYLTPLDVNSWLTTADFNGDGIADLAVSGYGDCAVMSGGVVMLLGIADGGFQAAVAVPTAGTATAGLAPLGPVKSPHALAIADACRGGITVYRHPQAIAP